MTELTKKSQGLFLWLSIAIHEIINDIDPIKCFEKMLASEKTETDKLMDEEYGRVLSTALGSRSGELSDLFPLVVGTILTVQEPLNISSLAMLSGQDKAQVLKLIERLRSVLLKSNEIVQVIHKSFADFVTDPS